MVRQTVVLPVREAVSLALLALCAGCSPAGPDGLSVELGAPRTVRVGLPVPLTLTLMNHGPDTIELAALTDSAANVHVLVFRPDGAVIFPRFPWGQLDGPGMDVRLPPSGRAVFRTAWAQLDAEGRQVPAGDYRVKGRFGWDDARSDTRTVSIVP